MDMYVYLSGSVRSFTPANIGRKQMEVLKDRLIENNATVT